MSAREQSLAQRRQELVDRSAAQRTALVADAKPLLSKAAAADRIVGMLRRYPVVTVLAVVRWRSSAASAVRLRHARDHALYAAER